MMDDGGGSEATSRLTAFPNGLEVDPNEISATLRPGDDSKSSDAEPSSESFPSPRFCSSSPALLPPWVPVCFGGDSSIIFEP